MAKALSLLGRWITRAASATMLAGLLGGIPWGLVVLIGWPLPREVNLPRTVEDVQDLLSTPLTDQMIVNLLALAMWFIWISFAASFAGEVIAAVRGVPSRRLPVLSPMQKLARWLLSGVTAGVLAAAALTPAIIAPPPPPAAAAAATVPAPSPLPMVDLTAAATTHQQTAPDERPPTVCAGEHVLNIDGDRWAYVAQRDDSLWRIAELCLGDGSEWPRIWELNQGRHFPQVGGTLDQPDLIFPGWDLYLPADALPPPEATPIEPDRPEPPTEPEPTQPEPEPAPPSPATPPPDDSPEPTPATPTPDRTAPAPATPSTPAPTATPDAGAEPTPAPPAGEPAADSDPDDRSLTDTVLPVTAALATAGLLSALVLTRLNFQRRRRQQHRRHGRRLAEPDPKVETAARTAAQPADVTRLDHALRALAAALHGVEPERLPDIVAVWLDGGTVHLLLAAACPDPPSPFVASAGAMSWTLSAEAELPEPSGQLAPLPVLATVASHPDGQHLLVDVERTGLLTITGDPDRRLNLLRYLAAEAATAEWIDHGEVVVVGFDPDETAQLIALNEERVRGGASVDEALARVQRRAAINTAALADTATGNAFAGRINDVAADAWMPHLLICADPTVDLAGVDQSLHATPRCGVAMVSAAEAPGRWNIHVDAAGRVSVDWLSIAEAYAAALPAEQLARLAPMLRTARSVLPPADAGFDEPVPAADESWAQGTDLHGHLLQPDIEDQWGFGDEELPGDDDLLTLDEDAAGVDGRESAPADEPDLWPEVHQPPPLTAGEPAPAAGPADTPTGADTTPDDQAEPGIDPAEGSPAVTNIDRDDDGVALVGADTTSPASPAETDGRLHPAFATQDPQAARPAATATASRRVRRPVDTDLDADLADWHAPTLGHARPRIGVLGPVTVEAPGEAPEDRERFFAEIVVFLASRGNRGAAPDQLDEAIWPQRAITANARRTAVSKVRVWLGESGDGEQWLPPSLGGDRIYRLADGCLFDWHLFRRLRARGEARGADGTTDLCRALELVRGAPLDGCDRPYGAGKRNPYSWLPASSIPPHHIASAVVDTAHQLVTLCLDSGDTTTARWAVEQAWVADPDRVDDHPWVDLMRIHHADGHRSEMRTLLEQLIEARGVEVPEELSPATFRAIDELAGDLLRVA